MVQIAPFRALRFSGQDMARVTCPPHDVMTETERDTFLERDPHNVARIVLGPDEPGDAQGNDKFTRAKALLQEWQEADVLARDGAPAFYPYEVTWGEDRKAMRGFFCRIRLDPEYQEIRRHEATLKRKRSERLLLRRATQCDTEAIWLLYRDERGWVDEVLSSNAMEELVRFTDEEGTEHRLWRVDRPEAVEEVQAQFEDRTVVIADGHHRYQTALDHHAETGRAEDESIMVCLVRDTDPGIAVLPTARLVSGLDLDWDEAMARATAWEITPIEAKATAARAAITDDRTCIVVGPGRAARLRLLEDVDEGRGALDALAVTRVHDKLLAAWGITDVERHLRFTHDDEKAVAAVGKDCQFAVLLAPEEPHAVLDVAKDGHLMPQKATFFIPKLRSGLVMGPLDELPPEATQVEGGSMEWRTPPL